MSSPVRPEADAHHLAAAEGGQHAEPHGEDVDQQDADQEGRQRDADQRHGEEDLRQPGCRDGCRYRRPWGCRARRRTGRRRAQAPAWPGSGRRSAPSPAASSGRRCRSRTGRRLPGSGRTGRQSDRRAPAPARSFWRSSSEVSCPTIWLTGSPTKRNSVKAMRATVTMTRTASNSRRMANASMSGSAWPGAERGWRAPRGPPRARLGYSIFTQ